MKSMHMLSYFQNKVEEANWTCMGLWPVSCDHLGTHPSLSQVHHLAPLAAQHSSTLGWGLPLPRGGLNYKGRSQLLWRMSSKWGWAANIDTYAGSTSGAVPKSDWGWDCHILHPDPCWSLSPSCSSTAPLWSISSFCFLLKTSPVNLVMSKWHDAGPFLSWSLSPQCPLGC